jgi:hypothetical protein
MDITLFGVFLGLSLILIALGLFRSEHTELSLVGFVFLFLLAMVVLNNQITYVIGTNTTSTFDYTYNYAGSNLTLLTSSFEENNDIYGPINLGGNLSHTVGYWLAIASVIGFIGVILGLRKSEGFK